MAADTERVTLDKPDLLAIIESHDEDGRMGRLAGGENWEVIQRLARAVGLPEKWEDRR